MSDSQEMIPDFIEMAEKEVLLNDGSVVTVEIPATPLDQVIFDWWVERNPDFFDDWGEL